MRTAIIWIVDLQSVNLRLSSYLSSHLMLMVRKQHKKHIEIEEYCRTCHNSDQVSDESSRFANIRHYPVVFSNLVMFFLRGDAW